MVKDYEALIIGAGPAGATAAILLARAGWAVAVVEKKRFPRRKVCGECISATNWPLLRSLGVAGPFFQQAGPELRRVGLFSRNIQLEADLPPAQNDPDLWGRALGREHLDTLLLARAIELGASVWQPWAAQAFKKVGPIYSCQMDSLEENKTMELRAPLIIAAHGSWEPGSLPTQPPRVRPRPSDLFAFKANFRGSHLSPGMLPVLAFPGGYGGMVVRDNALVTFACCVRRDVLQRARLHSPGTLAAEAILAYVKTHCTGVRRALDGAERQSKWLATGPIQPGFRGHHREGIWMLGNTANESHPIIGEGITMAMQSASLLCERLTDARYEVLAGRAWQAVGQDYARCWEKNFRHRTRAAALFAHLAMHPATMKGVSAVLRRHPGLLTHAARHSGKGERFF